MSADILTRLFEWESNKYDTAKAIPIPKNDDMKFGLPKVPIIGVYGFTQSKISKLRDCKKAYNALNPKVTINANKISFIDLLDVTKLVATNKIESEK